MLINARRCAVSRWTGVRWERDTINPGLIPSHGDGEQEEGETERRFSRQSHLQFRSYTRAAGLGDYSTGKGKQNCERVCVTSCSAVERLPHLTSSPILLFVPSSQPIIPGLGTDTRTIPGEDLLRPASFLSNDSELLWLRYRTDFEEIVLSREEILRLAGNVTSGSKDETPDVSLISAPQTAQPAGIACSQINTFHVLSLLNYAGVQITKLHSP